MSPVEQVVRANATGSQGLIILAMPPVPMLVNNLVAVIGAIILVKISIVLAVSAVALVATLIGFVVAIDPTALKVLIVLLSSPQKRSFRPEPSRRGLALLLVHLCVDRRCTRNGSLRRCSECECG